MNQKSLGGIIIAVLLLVTLSCQATNQLASQPSTSTPVVQQQPVVVEEPTATEDFSAATEAAAASAQATEEAAAQATSDAAAEAAAAEAAAATEEAARVLALTAEVETQATAQAQDFADTIQQLASDGTIEKTGGTYYWMDDFNENWAQIGWYQWWETGLAPTDFVIRARTDWESASTTANWFDSGCGFVFRETDEKNHYMIFLALDGNVYWKGYVDGVYHEFGKSFAGKINHLKGGADVMLAVEGPRVTYFVNGEKVLQRENKSLSDGKLALTLVSGTNKDYGTRCSITNIEIWELTGQ